MYLHYFAHRLGIQIEQWTKARTSELKKSAVRGELRTPVFRIGNVVGMSSPASFATSQVSTKRLSSSSPTSSGSR